ncbi:RNB-domain-containing protein [Fomitiporia mediterranea MF3/22]|uniref:RNB-domain-containing protein n=1 Tax=Fomitiporia mediterranea (strain MF3/22) TaxID=694068 RepID=UPI0004408264|nr:RNB-domain-containing protein [Fomitiporia mediterranea MF3/22]EJD04795.1 RNB-domain-containing protein [Fomitiporia mediterranea MF3/22]
MVEITIQKRSRSDAAETQRKFFRKTAKGKVLKVLRERYLRDDVSCGIEGCSACSLLVSSSSFTSSTSPALLPFYGITVLEHRSFGNKHFVLPDTNVFLHQMDLFESSLFTPPVVLLQTVLEEVRHRSLPLYARLQALIKMGEGAADGQGGKRIWVFYNEFRRETAVIRENNESPNDRNDRSIRRGAAWYNEHIAQTHLQRRSQKSAELPFVILFSDDAENRRRAEAEGVICASVRQYVEGMKDADRLLDLLSAAGETVIEPTTSAAARRGPLYPEYLLQSTLQAGIRTGDLHQGHFNPDPFNYLEGNVSVPAFTKPVLLIGRENMNRAVQGDVVVVEVFDEKDWKAPADAVVDQESTLRNDDPDESEEEEDVDAALAEEQERKMLSREAKGSQTKPSAEKQPTGRIVGIIKRNWRAFVCHIDRASLASDASTSLSLQSVFAQPVSRALPRIRMRTRQAPSLLGQKILVSIDRWDVNSRYPEGHFVRALGAAESKEAEQESLLLEYEVPYRPFGKAILDCLPKEGDSWVVPPKDISSPEWRDREDLRNFVICSIDPPGCQDIDDALHARQLPNGNIEAGVHIADVSHFVLPDNPMDHEAASRGTTVYLVDKRIDMLPSLLGTNLCSLRPFVERLAFSVIWEITSEAEIVNVRFSKSVIASKAAFTYEEAQLRKDDPHQQDELTSSIRLLNSLARKLRAGRMAAGALNLASPEVKIHLDSSESSDPIDVEQKELHETNSLVEEFMLLANISVAKRIQETFPQTAVLRRHLPPPHTNFEKLQDILKKRKNMTLDVSSSGALAASLDKCIDSNEPAFNTLVRIMATRCMLSAEYFCSGSVARDTFAHYGLASPIYTHFTSPIRRYADVLAHRQLAAAINYAPLHASLHSKSIVERILNVVNHRHRMAQMAGRASVQFYVGLALKARGMRDGKEVEVSEEAFVIRTFRNGLGVFVSKLGLEGLVMFKRETSFDAEKYTVTIPHSGKDGKDVTISVFDKVVVRISVEKDKNTQRGGVKMTLMEPVDSSGL